MDEILPIIPPEIPPILKQKREPKIESYHCDGCSHTCMAMGEGYDPNEMIIMINALGNIDESLLGKNKELNG